MGEELTEEGSSLAAPLIFLLVVVFQFVSRLIEHLKKAAASSGREVELRAEIKKLLREASALTQPSTFAQAAKLRRLAAAKEKELLNYQDAQTNKIRLSYDLYMKILFIAKVITYILLIFWFWRAPVAAISQQLVQPFGKVLSWGGGGDHTKNEVMVGIIPWLLLSTRVSKFISRFFN